MEAQELLAALRCMAVGVSWKLSRPPDGGRVRVDAGVPGSRAASGLVVWPCEMDHQRVADWSGLTQRLESSGAGRLELPFAEIERLIGGRLPRSSQYPAFWSNSSSYAKAWKRRDTSRPGRACRPGTWAL